MKCYISALNTFIISWEILLPCLSDCEFPLSGDCVTHFLLLPLEVLCGPWSFQLGLVEKDEYIMHIMYVCIYNIYMSVCVWSCTNFNNNSFWSALLMWFYIQIHQMDFESFSLYRAVYKGWRIFLAGWDWNICSKILPQKVNKICLPCVYKVRAVYIFMAV